MKYIDAVTGSIISALFFGVLAIYIHGVGSTSIVETILTISSFLFAIFSGFFISRLNDRYSTMRSLVSDEDAYFFSLFKMAKVFGEPFANKISDAIDDYYIASFEGDLNNYDYAYKGTMLQFNNIYDVIYGLKAHSVSSTYANMFATLQSIEEVRNKNSTIAKEKLTNGQWIVLISLVAIILFCLFYISTNQLFFQLLIVMLSAMLVLVLLTIRDLQYLRLGGKIIPVLESGQELLESIGKLRYYKEQWLESGTVEIPNNIKKYRLGLHSPGEKARIKVIVVE
ncbi:hypothetical protein HYW32_02275 [Candidatus Berkelbacteria bacterium]|nr:hypothetical protein [Candidatus Berkelbacteria bacterium]